MKCCRDREFRSHSLVHGNFAGGRILGVSFFCRCRKPEARGLIRGEPRSWFESPRLDITCAKHMPRCPSKAVHQQNAEDASWSARGRMGFVAPRFSPLSFAHICYATNMSGNHVLQGAQNVVIRGGTFIAAHTVRDAF